MPSESRAVLIVDDDLKFRQILKEFLELRGFGVQAVGSGPEALESLQQLPPQVILLDIKMPEMDGLETLRRVRVLRPNLPVILVTNVDDDQVMHEAGMLGSHEYVLKPFNFEHLETILLTKVFV